MAFDGVSLMAIKHELEIALIGARIDKVYQPERLSLLLNIRKERENLKLLLSAHPMYARICLTNNSYKNPKTPPLFCMVARKHLEGGKIISISQQAMERVLEIGVEIRTELGELSTRYLVVEIMGKHSNIIILDENKQYIVDSIKKVTPETSQVRTVLPNTRYQMPPQQNKLDLLKITQEDFTAKLFNLNLTTTIEDALLHSLKGVSPGLCKGLATQVSLNGYRLENCGELELNLLWQSVNTLADIVKNNAYHPMLIYSNNHYQNFEVVKLPKPFNSEVKELDSVNILVDTYYSWLVKHNSFISTKNNLQKLINKELKRCKKKLSLQVETIEKSNKGIEDKLNGELIIANIYRIRRGMKETQLPNYLQDNQPVTVKLKPELTPSENAQRYFRRYNKAKQTKIKAAQQAKATRSEIAYLESLNFWLAETIDHQDFEQLRTELVESGYLKQHKKIADSNKNIKPEPRMETTKDGHDIFIGKNNKQNDWLTFRFAQKDDIWFHAKGIPASHVILRGRDDKKISIEAIKKAAQLAAYYSKAKHSSNVPVDYTLVRNVKKIKGAKPGLVTYRDHKTVYVTPDKDNF